VPTGVKIALAVIWGIANAVYLAYSQQLAVSLDCWATAVANDQLSILPESPPGATGGTNYIQQSSEVSVLDLLQKAGDLQTEINNVEHTTDAIVAQADTLTTNVAALNTTLSNDPTDVVHGNPSAPLGIDQIVHETQADLQTLQTNVDVLRNTQIRTLTNADNELYNLNNFQTLQLRMDIEENLTRNGIGTGAIGLFQLPAANGGYLEIVKSIVTDTVNKETALGRGNSQSLSDLSTANSNFTAGHYKTAYSYYTKAYQDVR
jgi:hypothetical protein